MFKKFFKFSLFFLLCLAPFTVARAASTKTGNSVYVSKSEIINGNLFAAGQTVTVDGTVSGDLITAAQTINVNGQIGGDIIGVAQNIIINGNVGGNIRIAGSSLTINGSAARNVDAAGANIVLGPNSRIGWDVDIAGETAEVRGTIDGGVNAQVGQAVIAGKIGKDLNLALTNANHNLTVTSDAIINGDLNYTSRTIAAVDAQASIAGKIRQAAPVDQSTGWFILWVWKELFIIFATMVVGLVLIFITKNITQQILTNLSAAPLRVFLPGLIILFVLPPIALVLLFTIIGIPLSLLIITIWLIASYVAQIFTAILVGKLLLKYLIKNNNFSLLGPLVLGVTVCWLLFTLPWVGWIISLLAAGFGLGGIWSYVTSQQQHL
jgi:cytoskeletal protein CcmA (bactofilin family)